MHTCLARIVVNWTVLHFGAVNLGVSGFLSQYSFVVLSVGFCEQEEYDVKGNMEFKGAL